MTNWKTALGVGFGSLPVGVGLYWQYASAHSWVPQGAVLEAVLWFVVSMPASLIAPQFLPGSARWLFLSIVWACFGVVMGYFVDRSRFRKRARGEASHNV